MNPSDTTYAIVRETTEGVTPATPSFLYLDYIPGNDIVLDSKMLSSDVLKRSRAVSGYRKTSFNSSGTIKTQFRRDTAFELLMESAFSGRFASNVLKASNVDSYHTIEKKMIEAGSPMYFRSSGMQASKFNLTVDAESNVEASYDLIGPGLRPYGSTILTSATYANPTQGFEMDGTDVSAITIAGITANYMSLDLSVDHTRETKYKLGSASGFGVGTSGNRNVKLTIKLYRTDLSPEAVFVCDTPVPISFTIGSGVNGMRFDIPGGVGSVPKDEVSGAKGLVTIDIMATEDPASGTDIMATKLA